MANQFQGKISKIINVTDAITSRKIYMNQKCLDDVAFLRRYYEDRIYEVRGEELQVSLPVLVQWVFDDFVNMKLKHEDLDIRNPDETFEMGGE